MSQLLRPISGVAAYLRGGLGNQLFIMAASLQQARRLRVPLILDASTYALQESAHNYSLGPLDLAALGTTVVDSPIVPHVNAQRFARARRIADRRVPVLVERSFDYDERVQRVRPGTLLYGYFQSWLYVRDVVAEVRDAFEQLPVPAWQKPYLQALGKEWIAVHVRRGDYLKAQNAAVHGIISSDFYERALAFIRTAGLLGPVGLFSDDLESVIPEMSGVRGLIPIESPDAAAPTDVLNFMSRASAVVTSNSTFSWWAAYLRDGPDRPVVSPSPWFRDKRLNPPHLRPPWWNLIGDRAADVLVR